MMGKRGLAQAFAVSMLMIAIFAGTTGAGSEDVLNSEGEAEEDGPEFATVGLEDRKEPLNPENSGIVEGTDDKGPEQGGPINFEAGPDTISEGKGPFGVGSRGSRAVRRSPGARSSSGIGVNDLAGVKRFSPQMDLTDGTRASDDEETQDAFDLANGSVVIPPTETINGELSFVSDGDSDRRDWYKLGLDDINALGGAVNGVHNISISMEYIRDGSGGYDDLYEWSLVPTGVGNQMTLGEDYADLVEVSLIYYSDASYLTYMGGWEMLYDDQDDDDGWWHDDNWTFNMVTPIPSEGEEDEDGYANGLTEVGWYYIAISLNFYSKVGAPDRSDFTLQYSFTIDTTEKQDTDPASNNMTEAKDNVPDGKTRLDSFYSQVDWYKMEGEDPSKLWNISVYVNRTGSNFGNTSDILYDNWMHVFFIWRIWGEDETWDTADDRWYGYHLILSIYLEGGLYINDPEQSLHFIYRNRYPEADMRECYVGVSVEPTKIYVDDDEIIGYGYPVWRAISEYTIDYSITEEDKNQAPEITSLEISSDWEDHPSGGHFDTEFTFDVEYTDLDDDPPQELWLVLDPDQPFEEVIDLIGSEVDPADTDHTDGKMYRHTMTGEDIGDEVSPHAVMAYANDSIPYWSIRRAKLSERYYLNDTLRVWDDDPVLYNEYFSGIGPLYEDQSEEEVAMEQHNGQGMFEDPERSFRGFMVLNTTSKEWEKDEVNDLLHVNITYRPGDGWYALITPRHDKNGEAQLSFLGYDDHSRAYKNLTVSVLAVNDPPMVEEVIVGSETYTADNSDPSAPYVDLSDIEVLEDQEFTFQVKAVDTDPETEWTGLNYYLDDMASDDWNGDLEIDEETGEVTLVPDNEDVKDGNSLIVIDVDDGGTDGRIELEVDVDVTNVNDPPSINVPPLSPAYRRGERIEIRISGADVDPGDPLSYSVNFEEQLGDDVPSLLDQLPYFDPVQGVDWNMEPQTGYFWLQLDSREIWNTSAGLVSTLDIVLEFRVVDGSEAFDNGTVSVSLILPPTQFDNVQIRHEVQDEYPDTSEPEGRTVTFWVDPLDDPEGIIAYNWDLGDGTVVTGRTVEHTYGSYGAKTVTFWMDDGLYSSSNITSTVQLKEPPEGPDDPEKNETDGDGNGGSSVVPIVVAVVVVLIIIIAVLVFLVFRRKPPGAEEGEAGPEIGPGRAGKGLPVRERPGLSSASDTDRGLPPARGEVSKKAEGARCPSCGASVNKDWFLCPECKSPLN